MPYFRLGAVEHAYKHNPSVLAATRAVSRLAPPQQTFPISCIFMDALQQQFPIARTTEEPLPDIDTVFWDIGGVILTNGWDRGSRKEAAQAFQLDWAEFSDRHDLSFPAFDCGQITLEEYLNRTLFYRSRPFTREEFTAFMFAQSRPLPGSREVLDAVTSSGKYFVGAINNEPLELNQYRIEAFQLRRNFSVFFSSCYVHSRKPESTIFRVALEVTQRNAEKCIFIDDRPLNLESPRKLGFHTVHFQNPEQLKSDLRTLGVEV